MGDLPAWLGDINAIDGLHQAVVGTICIVASALCGAVIGVERERRDKPAGLRTVVLICLGSTIFTIVSLLLAAQKPMADPARLAAQIVTGIGFLGAGAILRAHGTVVGLTTGATIWTVAAVGVTIGAGYVAAGLVFTALILLVLTVAHQWNQLLVGRCGADRVTVVYRPAHGLAWPRIQAVLDDYRIPDDSVDRGSSKEDLEAATVTVCRRHREHRAVLRDLSELEDVVELRVP